jgi:hypothetical protein
VSLALTYILAWFALALVSRRWAAVHRAETLRLLELLSGWYPGDDGDNRAEINTSIADGRWCVAFWERAEAVSHGAWGSAAILYALVVSGVV